MAPTIAILGATGNTGRALVAALAARGARPIAVSRRGPTARPFAGPVTLRSGDLDDVESLAAAIAGADAVHHIPPVFDARERARGRNLIAAAARAGVPRLVYHSVLHASTPEMPHHRRKAEVEQDIRHSGLAWTILQPAMYAQTALAFLDEAAGALTPGFDPTRPFTPIHIGDLAEATAAVLVSRGADHVHATYELAGPERLDFVAIADRLSVHLGRPIAARRADPKLLAARVAAMLGLDAAQRRVLRRMFDHYDRYGLTGNANVLRLLLGREPDDFATAMRHSLAPARPQEGE